MRSDRGWPRAPVWGCDVTVSSRKLGVLFVALGACGLVRAELARTVPAAAPSAYAGSASAISPDVASRLADLSWLLASAPPSAAPGSGSSSAPTDTTETELNVASDRELPPGPGSLALGLGALGCLGAYQFGRSVKKINFGALPAWYHSDAIQVGHITPLSLDFSALPACVFDEPVVVPAITSRIPRELRSRSHSQFLLLIESPRGPPNRP